MRLEILVFAVALTGTLAIFQHQGGGMFNPGVLSRREVKDADDDAVDAANDTEPPTQEELDALVGRVLHLAEEGTDMGELGPAAGAVQTAADAILDARDEEVDPEEVEAVITDAASSLGGEVAVSELFAEPLSNEATKMSSALTLLNKLNMKVNEQDSAGVSTTATVAGISMTAEVMQEIMAETVAIVALYDNAAEKDGDD